MTSTGARRRPDAQCLSRLWISSNAEINRTLPPAQSVADAYRDAAPHEQMDLNEVIEWYLVSPITIADVPQF